MYFQIKYKKMKKFLPPFKDSNSNDAINDALNEKKKAESNLNNVFLNGTTDNAQNGEKIAEMSETSFKSK